MNIYFGGSMTGSQEKMNDYKKLIGVLKNYGTVLNPFVGEKMTQKEPLCVYNRDTENLQKTDILIADVSIPSTGVGFELGYADLLNIKTIIIYDKKYPLPSALILGNPKFIVNGYNTIEEAENIIKNSFNV